MLKTIAKTTQDILSPKVLGFILSIGIGTMLFWTGILWHYWGAFEAFVASYLTWIPWEWAQSTIAYLAAPLIGYSLMIITISTLTGLLSEVVLIALAKKHYPEHQNIHSVSLASSLAVTFRSIGIFILLLILLFPLTLIPILGQALMLYLWSILLNAPTVHDVGGLFIADKTLLKQKSKKSTHIAIIASLFNYIPLLNIFAPLFAQILFLHHILGKEKGVKKV